MISLAELPSEYWRALATELLAINKKTPKRKGNLSDLIQCRIASKALNKLLNDDFVLSTLQATEDIRQLTNYITPRIKGLIKIQDFSAFSNFTQLLVKYCDVAYVFKTVSLFLLFAVQNADLNFIQQYTQLTINNRPTTFTAKNIIKACEIAISKQEPKLSSFVFRCLLSFFIITNNVNYVTQLFEALDAGRKVANHSLLLVLQKKLAASNKPTLNSEILLTLFESDANKIIIPEGNLIEIATQDNTLAYKSAEMNFCITGSTIKYMTNKAVEKTIEISLDNTSGVMSYKGYSTKNQYALICRTSLFDEIFGTFPNHYVALTDEVVQLPPEQQPWFFGNISNDEAEAKLMGAANRRTFLTRSMGSQIWLQWSVPKRGARQTISHTVYSESQILYHKKFALGLYNGGVVRHLHAWKFYKLVCEGHLPAVLRYAKEHNIDLRSHEFQYPSPLGEFLRNYKKHGLQLVHWLLDNGVSLDPREPYIALALKLQLNTVVDRLLSKGVKCDTESLKTIILRKPTLEQFNKFWACFGQGPNEVATLLQVLLERQNLWSKERVHEKKVLTMLAYKYGNEDNYFKTLPKELVQYIISFGLDKPTWWRIADVMLNSVQGPISLHFSFTIMKPLECIEFFWENMDKFTMATHNTFLRLLFINVDEMYLPGNIEKLTYWVSKLINRMTPPLPTLEDQLFMPYLLQHCVRNSLSLLKLLVETRVVSKNSLTQVPVLDKIRVPAAWLAVAAGNKDIVKFLVQLEAMPLTAAGQSLVDYANKNNQSEMIVFIEACSAQVNNK